MEAYVRAQRILTLPGIAWAARLMEPPVGWQPGRALTGLATSPGLRITGYEATLLDDGDLAPPRRGHFVVAARLAASRGLVLGRGRISERLRKPIYIAACGEEAATSFRWEVHAAATPEELIFVAEARRGEGLIETLRRRVVADDTSAVDDAVAEEIARGRERVHRG
jgi:hypothetical protein